MDFKGVCKMDGQILIGIANERLALAKRKGHDYTTVLNGEAIDNLKITGLAGIAIRCLDKCTRAVALATGKDPKVKEESLRDTFIDLGNYSDFGVMFLDGTYDQFRGGISDGSALDDNKNVEKPKTTASGTSRTTGQRISSNPSRVSRSRMYKTPRDAEAERSSSETPGNTVDGQQKHGTILSIHSRGLRSVANKYYNIQRIRPTLSSRDDPSPVLFLDAGNGEITTARTPEKALEERVRLLDNVSAVHLFWNGRGLDEIIMVGMAIARGIPVYIGHISFIHGRPSHIHTLLSSLPSIS